MNKELETILSWLDGFGETANSHIAVLKRLKKLTPAEKENAAAVVQTLGEVVDNIEGLFDRLNVED